MSQVVQRTGIGILVETAKLHKKDEQRKGRYIEKIANVRL
jgi:hypothetical protein